MTVEHKVEWKVDIAKILIVVATFILILLGKGIYDTNVALTGEVDALKENITTLHQQNNELSNSVRNMKTYMIANQPSSDMSEWNLSKYGKQYYWTNISVWNTEEPDIVFVEGQ